LRAKKEKNLLKPTNKGTDRYTDAQELHYFTLGDPGCMQQAVSPNLEENVLERDNACA